MRRHVFLTRECAGFEMLDTGNSLEPATADSCTLESEPRPVKRKIRIDRLPPEGTTIADAPRGSDPRRPGGTHALRFAGTSRLCSRRVRAGAADPRRKPAVQAGDPAEARRHGDKPC